MSDEQQGGASDEPQRFLDGVPVSKPKDVLDDLTEITSEFDERGRRVGVIRIPIKHLRGGWM